MFRSIVAFGLALGGNAAVGCGGDRPDPVDSGFPTEGPAVVDSGTDAGFPTEGPDPGDAGSDAGADAGSDAGSDAGFPTEGPAPADAG